MPLPPDIEQGLTKFVDATKAAFGPSLVSVVLYGSGAEDALRPSSDVNVIVILSEFRQAAIEAVNPALVLAHAAMRLEAMFMLEEEISSAAEAFTVKFSDIARRRRVLYGDDPFVHMGVPRTAGIFRLRQVLLNLILRLRQAIALRARHEDELIPLLAESAGPLRAAAATLLELEERPEASAKAALTAIASGTGDFAWSQLPEQLSAARENRLSDPGLAKPALFTLLAIAEHMRQRALVLQP